MSITADQIDLWRSNASETQNLEFKEARQQYDTTKLCRYCVAIANEGGGHLVLGIADKLPRPVVGSAAFADTRGGGKTVPVAGLSCGCPARHHT